MSWPTRLVLGFLILVCAALSIVIVPPLALATAVVLPLFWFVRRMTRVLDGQFRPRGPVDVARMDDAPVVLSRMGQEYRIF